MGWIYKQAESDNYFAKFKGPDGRYKRVTTGTSDKAMAKKVMIELERIALKAKRNDGLIASTLVKYAQEASELAIPSVSPKPLPFFFVALIAARRSSHFVSVSFCGPAFGVGQALSNEVDPVPSCGAPTHAELATIAPTA